MLFLWLCVVLTRSQDKIWLQVKNKASQIFRITYRTFLKFMWLFRVTKIVDKTFSKSKKTKQNFTRTKSFDIRYCQRFILQMSLGLGCVLSRWTTCEATRIQSLLYQISSPVLLVANSSGTETQ